jgi:two-component sensor histidine kinase
MNADTQVPAVPVDGLALALVTASSVPVLLLDGQLTVIAASDSFCYAFHIDPSRVPERQLSELGKGEWDNPQVRALLRSTMLGYARVGAYEMELKRKDREPRRLVLNAVKLDTGDSKLVRILFSVTDITGELAAEALRQKLAAEKAALQQDIQHRIANGLQIITSVVLQTGRELGWRGQPSDMALAMAAVERRLTGVSEGDIEVAAYLGQLCDSLQAAMIDDPLRIALKVEADFGFRAAEDAKALGLIVTELVINALRHAFPEGRAGSITVRYRLEDGQWAMSVADDGVGIPRQPGRAGIGTSVVEVLARRLRANTTLVSSSAGTTASVAGTRSLPAHVQKVAAAGGR